MATLFIQGKKVTSPDIFEAEVTKVLQERPNRTKQLIDRKAIQYALCVYSANLKLSAVDGNVVGDLETLRDIVTILGFNEAETDHICNATIGW